MKAKFLPPYENCNGNLLWKKKNFEDKESEIETSLQKLRKIGYWVSPFPEGDGVTFKILAKSLIRNNYEMLQDFQSCFDWILIEKASSADSNTELADLEDENRLIRCIVIVPLEKIFIQETLKLGKFTYFCRKQFDPEPYERLTNYESEYVQFEVQLIYRDLLRLDKTFEHNDYVINKCLSLAEHALDIVRFTHSSFKTKEFTPNPAGQMNNGSYSVDIIPIEKTHLKPFELSGISRSISVSNNWLGPQVDNFIDPCINYLALIYSVENINNEMANVVISALRSCRQSFYSIGPESQFLNLVFTLDGLVNPESWTGWKQRTYIASLLSGGDHILFGKKLEEYDELYTNVRNKLVHEGKDFYELSTCPDVACEMVYCYIKDIINLIAIQSFNNRLDMKIYAQNLLKNLRFTSTYTEVINRVSASRGKTPKIPVW